MTGSDVDFVDFFSELGEGHALEPFVEVEAVAVAVEDVGCHAPLAVGKDAVAVLGHGLLDCGEWNEAVALSGVAEDVAEHVADVVVGLVMFFTFHNAKVGILSGRTKYGSVNVCPLVRRGLRVFLR